MNACFNGTQCAASDGRNGFERNSQMLGIAVELVRNPKAERIFGPDQPGADVGHFAGCVVRRGLSRVLAQGHQVSVTR
ncbi:hypothetical protein [Burkholderia territorii]|uniref:hypothetical protein n=1 Tax=Burkholderia territorii TaxID=1503055 RepID=UPI0012DA27CA|nr:hypothetical protein [Burkholderia territorii]